ncbi:hypothetical protein WJX73_010776 [Symbiochloris irregularis]|uniref:Uncharacterized protein n=1 Tax=Symbiochloris irregularis TaxID=706552 RepID=A0AAW1NX18_9CHLO
MELLGQEASKAVSHWPDILLADNQVANSTDPSPIPAPKTDSSLQHLAALLIQDPKPSVRGRHRLHRSPEYPTSKRGWVITGFVPPSNRPRGEGLKAHEGQASTDNTAAQGR